MKKTLVFILGVCLLATFVGNVSARNPNESKNIVRDLRGTNLITDTSVPGYYEAAAVDTYNIVKFTFEVNDWMGWTQEDYTAQQDTFWHVTNFGTLGGGTYGLLVPIEGSYSMWCGTEPVTGWEADPLFLYLCGWLAAPGYGNNWDQSLESEEITFEGVLSINFHGVFHNEGYGYDQCYLEYWDEGWVEAFEFGGYHDTIATYGVDSADVGGVTKFRFHFTADGAWSDQDGLYNTDGGAIVDMITVSDDGSYSNYEDFETAGEGAHAAGIWQAYGEPPFGIYSHMATGMIAPDPCSENYGTQVTFTGATELANQTLYPGQFVTPRCLNPVPGDYPLGPCQAEGIISPNIIMTKYSTANDENQDADIPTGDLDLFGGVLFRFTVYRDLPLDNLIFYTWSVRNVVDKCPGSWHDRGYVYYGPDKDYLFTGNNVSDLISGPNDTLQLTFGVQDMCAVWGGYYGTCTNHSPSPWFDNIRIQRLRTSGPQYSSRSLDLFQDNFPDPADTGTPPLIVRADAANDIGPTDEDWMIVPGDSIVVEWSSPVAASTGNPEGIKVDGNGPMVYIHVKATDQSPLGRANIAGSGIIGANDDWMTYISDDGTWTVLQGDTARIGDSGIRNTALPNYMFDLNDSLFTSGYLVEYYFSAIDDNDETSYRPTNALEGGAYEFACLPFDNNEILFVDDFDGRGSWDGEVQDYFDPALIAVLAEGYPDRYDMNAPSSLVGNGLASRTDDTRLGQYYNTIIWDSGDLDTGTIGNASSTSDEADDIALLTNWATDASGHNHKINMLIMGDGLVDDLTNVGETSFLNNILGVSLYGRSYFEETGGRTAGGIISPLVKPVSGSYFATMDEFWAFGGCPIVNAFDMLLTAGTNSDYGLEYTDANGVKPSHYAMVYSDDSTTNDQPLKTVTCGFSFMAIRDANSDGAPVKNEFLDMVWDYFGNTSNTDITDSDDPVAKFANSLNQNHPNPFNPNTRIEFSLKTRSHVAIRVYDVSGRLVTTLLNEVRDAGLHTDVQWKGLNDRGANVASGVYFYKIDRKSVV